MGQCFGGMSALELALCGSFLGPLVPTLDRPAFLALFQREKASRGVLNPADKLFLLVLRGEYSDIATVKKLLSYSFSIYCTS